ncbi:MAG: GspH/FimT family pseudopilin, partial [Comamonadaceae bacterium]|nr:GspH/FimT family pseudopilin [Comamonadaceae bacterium]
MRDTNNDAQRTASTEELIQQVAALSGDFKLTGDANVVNYVSYTNTGATALTTGGFGTRNFHLVSAICRSGTGQEIVINATSRPKVSPKTVS